MKNIFLTLLAALLAFSQLVFHRSASRGPGGGVPALYWTTDPNPARPHQVLAFQTFLARRGKAPVDLRIDGQNRGLGKVIIQGVSGVAGDLIDVAPGNVPYLAEMGLLEPLGGHWSRLGLEGKDLLPEVLADVSWNGEIWGHPMTISMDACLVNVDAFRRLGMEPPPDRWDLDAFERIGLEWTRRANAGKGRQTHFFVSDLPPSHMRRTAGISLWNETLTAPAVNDSAHVALLTRLMSWLKDRRLYPGEADLQSVSVDSGYGSALFQLFHRGEIAVLYSGRFALIQLRQMKGAPEYRSVEPPHGGYPCTTLSTRASVIYRGTRLREQALQFHAYLRSPEYGDAMVAGGDALPPNPAALENPEFLSPPSHPNEQALHRGLARMAKTIGHGREYSPFALYPQVAKAEWDATLAMRSGILTPAQMVLDLDERLRRSVQHYLKTHPEARARYDARVAVQREIDGLKAAGKPVPASKIENRFLRRYLLSTGKAVQDP